jgi:hypothetical protein
VPPKDMQHDPDFLHRWSGLSVYDSYREARRLAKARQYKRWAYIAELHIPDDAPIIFEGPDATGHWNLYGADPALLRDHCVARVLHAPNIESIDATI